MTYYIAAPVSAELAAKVRATVADVRSGKLTPRNYEPVVAVVAEVSKNAMQYFFIDTAKSIGVGGVLLKISEVGVSSALATLKYGLNKILPKLSDTQWKEVSRFLEDALVEVGK